MEAHLQQFEIELVAILRDDDLAVEHAAVGQLSLERRKEFGEVAVERLLVATLDEDFVAIAKDERAEAVPLRFEDPLFARRELAHVLGEHGQHGRVHGEIHGLMVPRFGRGGIRNGTVDPGPILPRHRVRGWHYLTQFGDPSSG